MGVNGFGVAIRRVWEAKNTIRIVKNRGRDVVTVYNIRYIPARSRSG